MNSFFYYNTIVVVSAVSVFGAASGFLGTLLQLRKQSLLSDAISHATLPGIAIAFLITFLLSNNNKSSFALFAGAAVSSIAGILFLLFLDRSTSLKEDTNLAIVISLFFGAGAFLLGFLKNLPTASAAGLNRFIYGKTASLLASDAFIICGAAIGTITILLLFFKEFNLFLFDKEFTQVQGYSTSSIDLLLGTLTLFLVILGLQAVGLILIIALFVLPALAARCWTDHIRMMLLQASIFGIVSAIMGTVWSSLEEQLPAGALIVLSMGFLFLVSFLFGTKRGSVWTTLKKRKQRQEKNVDLLLQSFSDLIQKTPANSIINMLESRSSYALPSLPIIEIVDMLHWSSVQRSQILRQAKEKNLIFRQKDSITLSPHGLSHALRVLRLHEWQHIFVQFYPDHAQSIHQRKLNKNEREKIRIILKSQFPILFHPSINKLQKDNLP